MTKPHRATPEQWAVTEDWAADNLSCYSCILELRARIESLEAAQQKVRSGPESPLVERVADAIAAQATSAGIVNDRPARAAILEVAAAAKGRIAPFDPSLKWGDFAQWLEQEANR